MRRARWRLVLSVAAALACIPALALAQQKAAQTGAEKAAAMGADCAGCHEATVKAFRTNVHAKVEHYGMKGDCAACHRGAAEHAQSGGDPTKIANPAKLAAEAASDGCRECHGNERRQAFWRGSAHEGHEVGCTACHSVHGGHRGLLARPSETALCTTCHFDVRSDLLKRSKHPLRDVTTLAAGGKMDCSSCHNPHGTQTRALIDARSVNDKCYECHVEKRAPVLWEHSPVKEDCLTCHTAHGSIHDKLLTTRVPRLCQECHMQGRHQSGTLAQNSTFAFNRSCLNCHPQVHGSNNPSGTVLQR